MADTAQLTFLQRITRGLNNLIMTRLVPLDRPSRFFRGLFRFPVFLYRVGLDRLVPGWILLLTTTGRKSGQPRYTTLEYWQELASGEIWIMAGWAGNTDWFKNVLANPFVGVQVGKRHFQARARRLSDEEVVRYLKEMIRLNPGVLQILPRWAGHPVENTDAGLRTAAPYFPVLALREERRAG
jgi:deazaflavin-dependent oxidoreductase (nitroreductase family)